jgi:hypothetical protein
MRSLQMGLILVALIGCKKSDTNIEAEDRDNDGSMAGEDCNDEDGTIFPGAEEICDGLDNDCDGEVENLDTYYADVDGDGYGDPNETEQDCSQPQGYVLDDGDCDDTNAEVHPDAEEACNGEDDDCDGVIDDGVSQGTDTYYADTDGDGFGDAGSFVEACEQPDGYVSNDDDCDDTTDTRNPDATELCNGIDEDCDSSVDEGATGGAWYTDADGDGYGDDSTLDESCEQPAGTVATGGDCDDTTDQINPAAVEICNGIDDDCDGFTDDGLSGTTTWYADADGDGHGDASSAKESCVTPVGYVTSSDDCDDTEATSYPGASETCDDLDNDCDGVIDDSPVDPTTWYVDADGDGYGDPSSSTTSCDAPVGYVSNDDDCLPADSSAYPSAVEYCDGVDDDCDGTADDNPIDGDWYYPDADGDGFGDATLTFSCDGADNDWDCNDSDTTEPIVVDTATGSSSGSGTASSPKKTIQQGIDAASECVVVYAGTYAEDIDFGGKDLVVSGVEGADTTIIDGTGTGAVVSFEGGESSAAVLEGFTITGGTGRLETSSSSWACTSVTTCTNYYSIYCGGGIVVDGSDPTLRDLIVDGNSLPAASTYTSGNDTYYTYSYGGGICLLGSAATLEGVDLQENDADQGGALYVDDVSNVDVSECYVTANTATDGGAFEVDGGVLTLTNVASTWNDATDDGGGVLVISGTLYATNVTHGGDDATNGGGIYLSGTSTGTVMNTIIYGAATGVGVLVDSTSSWSGTYNDVFGNSGGRYSGITDPTGTSGNVSANPAFTAVSNDGNPWNDTWTLTSSSPVRNAGNPAAAYNDTDATRNDMGAWGGPGGGW